MTLKSGCTAALLILLLASWAGAAQSGTRKKLAEGSAVVRTEGSEYTITILCDDAQRPELGFTTEANRVTRAATGRSNMVNLRLRPWKDTGDVVVNLEGWTAWIPQPSSAAGVLSLDLVLRPNGTVKDNMPILLTYEMWKRGEIAEGERAVAFEATCSSRNPEAPSYRKVSN